MLFGETYNPNLVIGLPIFVLLRGFFYWYWFYFVKRIKTPYVALAVHTFIYIAMLPTLLGAVSLILADLPNNLFWFVIVPVIYFLVSFSLHRLYRLTLV
jgi:hypothetical protein